jgi:hypothetical protein
VRAMKALTPLVDEFESSELPDRRLLDRLVSISAALESDPEASFPAAIRDRSQLEGLYRFFGNERVELPDILSGHVEKTLERCSRHDVCLAIHDTTDFSFKGERTGLGVVDRAQQGFYGHFCLAVAPGEHREPLGLLAVDTWMRQGKKGRRRTSQRRRESNLESDRWLRQSQQVEALTEGFSELIHVEDREGDIYDSLKGRLDAGHRFVVRGSSNRVVVVEDGTENVLEHARSLPRQFSREVYLSARKRRMELKNARSARRERAARLGIAATSVALRKPKRSRGGPAATTLNVVHVIEEGEVPDGEERAEWLLYTTEPVSTQEQLELVVDAYRTRWLIEEYFKAIKTGCKYEERQLESGEALLRALGVFAVLAWRLLVLRFIERTADDAPVELVATTAEIEVLRAKELLPEKATAMDFMKAVAKRGGHLSNNGRPGYLVLWRGLRSLESLVEGWLLATASPRLMTDDG